MVNLKKVAELSILSVVAFTFAVSAYRFVTAPIPAPSLNTISTGANIATRAPASVVARTVPTQDSGYVPYETHCDHKESYQTVSGKIRIIGPLCGFPKAALGKTNFTISNSSNTYVATVFQDLHTHTFSTDFIPLQQGDNRIEMSFDYGRAPASIVQLNIKRTPKN